MKKRVELTDEDFLWKAAGVDGCHADTEEALAACRRLEERGLVYEGPFKNLGGNPVFFAHERRVEKDATPGP
jgi:hypothetical protein